MSYLYKVAIGLEMKGSVGAILSGVVLEQHSHLEDKVNFEERSSVTYYSINTRRNIG